MGIRKVVLISVLTLTTCLARAQIKTYVEADSVSNALYKSGDWKELIKISNDALKDQLDFVSLRSRLGYAYFVTGNYSEALIQYQQVLAKDANDKNTRYFIWLCQLYLNNGEGASLQAGMMGTELQKSAGLTSFRLIDAGAETGLKSNSDYYRGTASYSRISFGVQLAWRLQLEQSFAYFGQPVSAPDTVVDHDKRHVTETPGIVNSKDNEFEYYTKATFAASKNLVILGAFHYLQTRYFDDSYYSNLGLLGLKYEGSFFNLQGDVNFGQLVGHGIAQYNGAVMVYPLGNLNLYTISRFSYLQEADQNFSIFNQSIGFKAFKNTWLETLVTFGKLDNYIDTDALYIYNSIDVSTFKIGETAFYQAGKHAQLRLNYTLEKKYDAQNNVNYNQASLTASILWVF
jgi:tetratricopeptide (TPR) repeat protein